MAQKLLPTTLVGSYPQPEWLIDRASLSKQVPRVRVKSLWRIPEDLLENAQDDGTILAIRDQERAGIDILTDGEIRRESYSNRFASALDGIDHDNPGSVPGRTGRPMTVPRIVAPIKRRHPVQVRDVAILRANTERTIKITVPGPFTMAQQCLDEHYEDERARAMDFAVAVNQEIRDLFEAGADWVQIDEPYMQAQPEKARDYGLDALNHALDGVQGTTCVHLCFGYAQLVKDKPSGYSFLPELDHANCNHISVEFAQSGVDPVVLKGLPSKSILLGVLDLSTNDIETPDVVAGRIRKALEHVPAERIVVAPDCGMKYLPRDVAFGKMQAMVAGADRVRAEL